MSLLFSIFISIVIKLIIFPIMCECEANRSMDIRTPRNVHLSAFYKRSFAFYTVKTRMPVIVTNLLDNLVRNKVKIAEEFGEEAREELKTVIGDLSELKYEIQTNKQLKPLTGSASDVKIYNDYIAQQISEEGQPTYFHTIWLLSECYMYRRIRQIFENTKFLKDYDPFQNDKILAFYTSLPLIQQMGKYLLDLLDISSQARKEDFISLIKLNLWGNKCDLSISLGKVSHDSSLFNTATLDSQVLCDDSEKIWDAISDNQNPSTVIDIVFDNMGYEVFTDLCLADYMISTKLTSEIRMYVKTIPWFISDVMRHDFFWTLDQLKQSNSKVLQTLGTRWTNYVDNGTWTIIESHFWTLPFDFTYMPKVDPLLYQKLSEAKVVIFKGDLNYRKLFGEINWDPTTPLDVGLQNFHPTKLCILRTIKADIVCGLEDGVVEKVEALDPKWMEKGDYAVIQFSDKVIV